MNRRSFLRSTAASSIFAGSAQTLSALAADDVYRAQIGIQLFTMRNGLGKEVSATINRSMPGVNGA